MVIFSGDLWVQVCKIMWIEVFFSIKIFVFLNKGKDVCFDEVLFVKFYGGGKVQFFWKWINNLFWIFFGEIIFQELVVELGFLDVIYCKNDQCMYIYKLRIVSNVVGRLNGKDFKDDMMDMDQLFLNYFDGY